MSDVVAGSSPAPTNSAPSSSAPSTATPASPTAGSSTPASASATPATPATPSAAPSTEQQIPYARFKEVNDQLKSLKEYREQYGWAETFQTNPYPYLEQWLDQAAGHPEMGPKLLAKAARMLQSRRGQATATEEPAPDVPIMDGAGNVVSQTYSAQQLKKWQEWSWQQREAALQERLSPLEQMKTALETRERQAQIDAHSQQHATSTLGALRKSEVFAKHEPQFKQFFAEHEEYGDNVHAAWWDYYQGSIAPTLAQTEQAKVLDHLQTQANGATVHPSGSQVSGPPKFKSFKEASEYFEKHPEEAARMAQR